ncbi:MAG: hypothetical protein ACXW1S_00130 [Acidimicrobiia bacterium]
MRWGPVLVMAVALTVPSARPAAAADVGASTSPAGARVEIGVDGAYQEQGSPGSGGGSGVPGGGCVRRWVPETAIVPGVADYLSLLFGPPPSPAHLPYSVYCGDAYLGAAWILPTEFTVVPSGPTVAEIAAAVARDLPYPVVSIGANPGGRGLTGLASWFWIDGYDGDPIVDAVTGFGTAVEVEARASAATWDFGDDSGSIEAPIGGGPTSPSATHVYDSRSGPGGFTVTASFSFSVRYRVNGGAWIELPPVARDAARAYEVVESRGQLVPSEP